jgi:hypothetical protein
LHIMSTPQRDTESPPVLVSGESPDCSYDGDHPPADASSDPLLLPPPMDCRTHLISSIEKRIQQSLAYYVRFTASAAHQDKLLKFLQWSLWIWGTLLQQRNASSSFRSSQQSLRSLALSRWVLKLYGEVSMARYVTRLLGFPHAVEAVVNASWTSASPSSSSSSSSTSTGTDKQNMLNTVYSAIGKVLSWSMVGYHPTELAAYVLWMKPASSTAAIERREYECRHRRSLFPQISTWSAETWSYVSCRFWLAYVVAELLQCVVQGYELRSLLQEQQGQTSKEMEILEDTSDELDHHTQQAQLQRQLNNVTLQGLRNALFLVPCIQWSLPHWDTRPWLPVSTVNTLMWLESIVCLYQALRNTP